MPVASYHPNLQLAIGSAFKLYVLAELIRAVEAGERRWEEVVRLSPEAISFPSGILQEWPVGSPLTLHSVASLMISLSDNTATDLLIQTLERKRLEDMLKYTGHSAPEKNIPFLRTLELFKLKGEPSSNLANKYINLDAEGKRTLLEGEIARMNRSRLTFPDKLHLIKSLEWFASCEDLARVLNWIRQHTNKDTTGRAILTINTGLSIPRSHWNYIGYKGGSEPGVLNLSYLLQSRKGLWYAAIATWNDEEKALEESKLFTLLLRAIQLLED